MTRWIELAIGALLATALPLMVFIGTIAMTPPPEGQPMEEWVVEAGIVCLILGGISACYLASFWLHRTSQRKVLLTAAAIGIPSIAVDFTLLATGNVPPFEAVYIFAVPAKLAAAFLGAHMGGRPRRHAQGPDS